MRTSTQARPKKLAPPKTNTLYQVGEEVTNAKGWHGIIKRIDTESYPHPYYWVWWEERANHEDKLVQKAPICGHLENQIWTEF